MTKKMMTPPLRLTPYAWAKLLHLRDLGPTEVGGFGISAVGDLLLIEDIRLIRQTCTAVTVRFDDEAVADYFDEQVDQGQPPEQFGRIWIHTHPGNSAVPSTTDERTFARCFGSSDWALMLIVACGGQTYARLRFKAGPGGAMELPVDVDFKQPFPGADQEVWNLEYQRSVQAEQLIERPLASKRAVGDRRDFFVERDPYLGDPYWDDQPLYPFLEAFDERLGIPF